MKAWLVALLVLGATATAGAVPSTISFSGRLSTSKGVVEGPVNLTFRLHDVATGGTPVWFEDRAAVEAKEGLVFVDLGAVTTLDTGVFKGAQMFLEIVVDGETLSPRVAINSVPYAMHTADSDTLGGTVAADDVITSVTGTNGITATKTGNALAVSLATAGCGNGQVLKFNGAAFACADDIDTDTDTNTPPVAGNGIAVTGNTVSLATTGCQNGQVFRFNNGQWACADDGDGVVGNEITAATDTTLTRSGAGTAASPFTLGLNTANANAWTATQTFATANTTTASIGTASVGALSVTGRASLGYVRVSAAGSTAFSATCTNWTDRNCFQQTATVTCPANTVVIGGGCSSNLSAPRDVNLAQNFPLNDTTWSCAASAFVDSTLTAHAICARLAP